MRFNDCIKLDSISQPKSRHDQQISFSVPRSACTAIPWVGETSSRSRKIRTIPGLWHLPIPMASRRAGSVLPSSISSRMTRRTIGTLTIPFYRSVSFGRFTYYLSCWRKNIPNRGLSWQRKLSFTEMWRITDHVFSYNRLNGTHASENQHLLQDILRKEWDCDALVMSDWWVLCIFHI